MLSKSKRLNLKKDFKWVAQGKSVSDTIVKLMIRFGDNQFPKVGIAVSSQTFKKAVKRNRARRLISKGFEILYDKLPGKINIIALPRAAILEKDANKVQKQLEELLTKEGLFNL